MFYQQFFDCAFVFHACSANALTPLVDNLRHHKSGIYYFNSSRVDDRSEFLKEISHTYSQNISSTDNPNWDSVSDRLWHTLMAQPHENVAMIVNYCDQFIHRAFPLFLEFVEVFLRLSCTLFRNPEWPTARSVCLRVILLGETPAYPCIPASTTD